MKLKILSIIILLFACFELSFAQKDQTEELKKEVTSLKQLLNLEKEKVTYLKGALDLRSNSIEIIQDSISIKITGVKGDLKNKTIAVKGLVTYLGNVKRNIQFPQQTLVDPEGNIYDTYTAVQSNDLKNGIFIQDVEKDIPYGFVVIFKKVEEKVPTASLIRLQIYGNAGAKEHKFNFKAIDIIWE